MAARLSAYDVKDGGWIDNRKAKYSYQNARGYTIDNYSDPYNVAKNDYNDSRKEGSRLRISADINDVKLDLSFLTQESYYNGSYETDVLTDDQSAPMPARSNSRFSEERYDDSFDQTSLTLSGSINDSIDFVLNTSIFERDTAYTYDYASYVEYYYYAAYAYYVCNLYEYYGYYYADVNDCRDPRMTYAQSNDIERKSTELRFQSNYESGFNWVLGAFQETNEKVTDVDFLQPGASFPNGTSGTWWEADLDRKGDIDAIFGEIYYDLNDKTSLTVGLRSYDQTMHLKAVDGYYGALEYGLTDGDFKSSESGNIKKVSLKHNINDDFMIYGNYSEGFRPSGVNRPRPNASGFSVPETYEPDYLDSLELGFKSTLNDGKLF